MTPEDLQAAWPCIDLQLFTDDPGRFQHLGGCVNAEVCAGMPPRSVKVSIVGHRLDGSTNPSDSAYFTFHGGSHLLAEAVDFGPLVDEFGGNRPPLLRNLWSCGSRLINEETYHEEIKIAVLIWVGTICDPGSPPIREQLARRIAAIRDSWATSPSGRWRSEIIELECRVAEVPAGTLEVFEGGMNATKTCGVPSKHLHAVGSWSTPLEGCDGPGHLVFIRLVYSEHPYLRSTPRCPAVDFDGPLAELDRASGSWRTKPGLL